LDNICAISLPDGARCVVNHRRNLHSILNRFRDIEDGERHGTGDENGCVREVQTGTNTPAKPETDSPRVLLWLSALSANIAIGIKLGWVWVCAWVIQHVPGRVEKYLNGLHISIEKTDRIFAMTKAPFGM
jgi:hypothetical protein